MVFFLYRGAKNIELFKCWRPICLIKVSFQPKQLFLASCESWTISGIFYEQTTASSAAAPQEIDESLDVENAGTTEIREKETTTEESTETSESLQTSDSLQQMEANKSEMSAEESQTWT